MKHVSFLLVSALILIACPGRMPDTQMMVRTEHLGCTADLECNDNDPASRDWCVPATGTCHHEREVRISCNSMQDCNDNDPMTVDACRDGVCHHTVERDVFDPAAPERQDAYNICEQLPTSLGSCNNEQAMGPYASVYYFYNCVNGGGPAFWSDPGYTLPIWLVNAPEGLRRVRIHLQLRTGDPRDQYDVKVVLGDPRRAPIMRTTLTVQQIESGITVDFGMNVVGNDAPVIYFILQPVGEVLSRTIQWALPEHGIENLSTREEIVSCFTVGHFMRVPSHGFLHLGQSSPYQPVAQCQGMPARPDVADVAAASYGFVREMSDPEVHFVAASGTEADGVYSFHGLAGLIDWATRPGLNAYTLCSRLLVLPDGTLARSALPRRRVGIGPGMRVDWVEGSVIHTGVTDHDYVIREYMITPGQILPGGMGRSSIAFLFSDAIRHTLEGTLDLTSLRSIYRVVPAALPPLDQPSDPAWSTLEQEIARLYEENSITTYLSH